MNKFKVGDKVTVVKYGHWIYLPKSEWNIMKEADPLVKDNPNHVIKEFADAWLVDLSPEMVGRSGVVDKVSSNNGFYSLTEIEGKNAWYGEDQLELKKEDK